MTVTQLLIRRGTAAQWTSTNPVLGQGEPGFETDTGKLKVGDGASLWSSLGYLATTAFSVTNPVYSVSITPNLLLGSLQVITVTNTTAFTINAPSTSAGMVVFEIFNNSGGTMGAITWNAIYALAGAFTNPANTKRRTISFFYDGASFIEIGRAAADI